MADLFHSPEANTLDRVQNGPIDVQCDRYVNHRPESFYIEFTPKPEESYLLEMSREEAERVVKTLTKYLAE